MGGGKEKQPQKVATYRQPKPYCLGDDLGSIFESFSPSLRDILMFNPSPATPCHPRAPPAQGLVEHARCKWSRCGLSDCSAQVAGHPLRRSYVDASLLPSRLIRSIIFTKHRVTLRRAHGAALLPASLCLATLLDLRDYARLESRDSCVVKVLSMPKASSE